MNIKQRLKEVLMSESIFSNLHTQLQVFPVNVANTLLCGRSESKKQFHEFLATKLMGPLSRGKVESRLFSGITGHPVQSFF